MITGSKLDESKNYSSTKTIIIMFVGGCLFAALMGFLFRPLVSRAADPATPSDSVVVATDSDAVDTTPYLTYDSDPTTFMDLLLSVRNVLVCIWGTMIFFWSYDRLKAIICRLGGVKKNE